MFFRKLAITAAAACTALAATPAAAVDSAGVLGVLAQVTVLADSSDTYGMYHGQIQVVETSTATIRTYRWGGSLCPNRDLPPDMVQLLVDSMHNRPVTTIVPAYKLGNGSTRCLVGFTLNYVP